MKNCIMCCFFVCKADIFGCVGIKSTKKKQKTHTKYKNTHSQLSKAEIAENENNISMASILEASENQSLKNNESQSQSEKDESKQNEKNEPNFINGEWEITEQDLEYLAIGTGVLGAG